jgi:hypothetical protein
VEAARVDAAHAAGNDARLGGGPHHERIELLTARLRLLLRVVVARECPALGQREALEVEQNRGRGQRARERAAPGLVGTRYEPPAEITVESEQLAPDVALRLPALLRLPGGRSGLRRILWRAVTGGRGIGYRRVAESRRLDGRRRCGLRGFRCAWEASM